MLYSDTGVEARRSGSGSGVGGAGRAFSSHWEKRLRIELLGMAGGVSLSARRASRRGVGGLSRVELPVEERDS